MAEQRRALAAMDDAALAGALGDLAAALAYPSAAAGPSDIAAIVRQRLVAEPPAREIAPASSAGSVAGRSGGASSSRSPRSSSSPRSPAPSGWACPASGSSSAARRHRPPTATPSPSPSPAPTRPPGRPHPPPAIPLGLTMGLGTAVSLDDAARIGGLDLVLPTDPAIGPPDAVYTLANRVALVWSERPGLPADPDYGVGLLLSEFRGHVDDGYYQKTLDEQRPGHAGDGRTATPATGSAARRTSSTTSTRPARPSTTATGSSATRSSGRTARSRTGSNRSCRWRRRSASPNCSASGNRRRAGGVSGLTASDSDPPTGANPCATTEPSSSR